MFTSAMWVWGMRVVILSAAGEKRAKLANEWRARKRTSGCEAASVWWNALVNCSSTGRVGVLSSTAARHNVIASAFEAMLGSGVALLVLSLFCMTFRAMVFLDCARRATTAFCNACALAWDKQRITRPAMSIKRRSTTLSAWQQFNYSKNKKTKKHYSNND